MDNTLSENISTDCETSESSFPVDALLKILQMEVQHNEMSPTSGEKRRKVIQSQYKNLYSLVVVQARHLLEQLVLALSGDDLENVGKEYRKSNKEWTLELQKLNMMLTEFESVDERYSKVKKEVQRLRKLHDDKSILVELKKEKDELYCQRKKIQKGVLKGLQYKRFAFLVPIHKLIGPSPGDFLELDKIRKFLEDKSNSCSKSRALTTLSLYLQNDLKVGLLIVHIALALLSPSEESQNSSAILKKSDVAFRYWMIKSAMTTKTKLLLRDQKKRAYMYEVFQKVSENLQEEIGEDLTKEHIKCLDEISGRFESKSLLNLNAKRPSDLEEPIDFPIKKQIKK